MGSLRRIMRHPQTGQPMEVCYCTLCLRGYPEECQEVSPESNRRVEVDWSLVYDEVDNKSEDGNPLEPTG